MSEANKSDAAGGKLWAAAGILVLVLFAVIPTLVAVAFWMLLRPLHVKRGEWGIVLFTTVLVLVFATGAVAGSYFAWLVGLFPPDPVWWPIPVVSIAAWSMLLTSLFGVVYRTATFNKVAESSAVSKVADKLHIHLDDPDSILPDPDRPPKQKKRWFGGDEPDPEKLTRINTTDHAADSHDFGSREFGIGLDKYGNNPVLLSEREIGTHMVLVGSTGSGKTTTLMTLIGQLGDLGWSVIMLDLKEDTEKGGLRDFMRDYAVGHALRYQEIALSQQHNKYWFNPLRGMTIDEAINTILSLQEFDDGHWQAINRTLIGQIVTLFYDAHEVDPERFPEPDMYSIGKVLSDQNFPKTLAERVAIVVSSRRDRTKDDFSALIKPQKAHLDSASGLSSRIVNMYESEAGRKVLRAGDERQPMDVTAGGFVYVGLNTLGMSELARVVSTSALLKISAEAGQRTTGQASERTTPTAVIIDEANWIDRMSVKNLLSRARSAGIMVALATQGPLDWIDEHGNDWDTITQNTNVSVIMKQGNEASAELCADLIGKKEKTSVMSQIRDGDVLESGSQTTIVDHIVAPHEIRQLGIGEAILKVSTPERVQYVKVARRGPT